MFVAGILRLFLYGILIYIVLAILKGLFGPGSPPETTRNRTAAASPLVQDEVCGTFLAREDALREVIDGRERFFCSPECRAKAKSGTPPAQ
jgi:uncharacterized protein